MCWSLYCLAKLFSLKVTLNTSTQRLFKLVTGAELTRRTSMSSLLGGQVSQTLSGSSETAWCPYSCTARHDGDFRSIAKELSMATFQYSIRVFSEPDNAIRTFEISMYQNNAKLCDDMFSGGRIGFSTGVHGLQQ